MISSLKTLDFLFFQTLEFWSYSSKQWNSGSVSISIEITSPIFWHIGILILSFQTLRYWPFLYKHWTYNLILAGNVGILALFLYILEFLFFSSRSWYSIPISISIVILMLFFWTMEFWPQFYKDWNNNLILPNIRILALFLYTLEFWPNIEFWRCSYKHLGILNLSFYCNHWNFGPHPSTHSNSGLIFTHSGIPILSFQTLEFWLYFYTLILSFKTLGFWPYFYKHCKYDLILANTGFRALFLYTLEFLSYPSKD